MKDLEKAAEIRTIVCGCVLLVVDGQQVLTMSRTADGDAYAITSTDPTLVQRGLDYWESPRCCVARFGSPVRVVPSIENAIRPKRGITGRKRKRHAVK